MKAYSCDKVKKICVLLNVLPSSLPFPLVGWRRHYLRHLLSLCLTFSVLCVFLRFDLIIFYFRRTLADIHNTTE